MSDVKIKANTTGAMNSITALVVIVWWFAGIVIGKGVWGVFAVFCPPFAWYLVVEKVMIVNGWN